MLRKFHLLLAFLLVTGFAMAQQKPRKPLPPIYVDATGKLAYTPDTQGNRIPDFSYCGYMAGALPLPIGTIQVVVPCQKGDATARIQAALDYVATLPTDATGIRGVVLLEKGTYNVERSLFVRNSGVILRGAGMTDNGTKLVASPDNRDTFIYVKGKYDRIVSTPFSITSSYVPVNAQAFDVAPNHTFKIGDKIIIRRPSTQAWIDTLGTNHFGGGVTALGWKPNQRELFWDRTITNIEENRISIDAPITTALDAHFGGGTVASYQWTGRIQQVGIENLSLIATYHTQNPKDEDHRWVGISLENVQDAWVRQVTFKHFASSAVFVQATAKRVTVEDCISTEPISEIGGQRRLTFFTTGQQTLFQRLYAEQGYHDFAVGYCAAGPNAFVQCEASQAYSYSGAIDSWASGVLFDIVNIDGNALRFANIGQDGQGAGWTAANSVFWQCAAARVECFRPPTAQNWAFGTWAQFAGDGYWDMSNEHIKPRSLYYAQLTDRLGTLPNNRMYLMPTETEASSSPKVEVALALTQASISPAATLQGYILEAAQRTSLPTTAPVKSIDKIGLPSPKTLIKQAPLQVVNGWLTRDKTIQTGRRQEVPWWSGSARPYALAQAKPHITRFVPGQTGWGLTDDLDSLTDWMQANHVSVLDHNYGLWYDRRRDDHERIRRMDGEVWPPFYELPFARSGKESAWDGLSKYDLTQYNRWYWLRLKQFANLADQKSLVLFHQNYFQHNIIEAGAHYADFPWRPANNINQTGFPEPVPYAGDKRIFMAEQFYDIQHPVRRKIHEAYIRQCLDNFIDNSGVVQLISAEYTGPLHFVQFWLDVIKAWEKEKGKNVLVALSTTKDVQDAILADKERRNVVDIIDIRYWHYQADGKTYEPKGGQNLAPRQHARLLNPKRSSFEQVYRAVYEYRKQYPAKAVIYNADSFDTQGWAILMAGGSLANITQQIPSSLLQQVSGMIPLASTETGQYTLASVGKSYLIYQEQRSTIQLDLSNDQGTFLLTWINPKDGKSLQNSTLIQGGQKTTIPVPSSEANVAWLQKQ